MTCCTINVVIPARRNACCVNLENVDEEKFKNGKRQDEDSSSVDSLNLGPLPILPAKILCKAFSNHPSIPGVILKDHLCNSDSGFACCILENHRGERVLKLGGCK